ncbi:hypothetical protein ANCDUO_26419 [Ancylostoma duodenale]|uniref:Uncharacterized protein n=1 Tax=Ancylostoma duodenale TaxID=51022 RepID=A0A0C2C1V7_9BILA|nr:hypothetical protein ANCDUO_26419 [Ancylostoma duodenale]
MQDPVGGQQRASASRSQWEVWGSVVTSVWVSVDLDVVVGEVLAFGNGYQRQIGSAPWAWP